MQEFVKNFEEGKTSSKLFGLKIKGWALGEDHGAAVPIGGVQHGFQADAARGGLRVYAPRLMIQFDHFFGLDSST